MLMDSLVWLCVDYYLLSTRLVPNAPGMAAALWALDQSHGDTQDGLVSI